MAAASECEIFAPAWKCLCISAATVRLFSVRGEQGLNSWPTATARTVWHASFKRFVPSLRALPKGSL